MREKRCWSVVNAIKYIAFIFIDMNDNSNDRLINLESGSAIFIFISCKLSMVYDPVEVLHKKQ